MHGRLGIGGLVAAHRVIVLGDRIIVQLTSSADGADSESRIFLESLTLDPP